MQTVIPGGTKRDVKWIEAAVNAAADSEGDVISTTTDPVAATLENIGNFAIEFQLGAGSWTRLEPRNLMQLDVSLAKAGIRARRAPFSGVARVRLEVESLVGMSIRDDGAGPTLNLAGFDVTSQSAGGPATMALSVNGVVYSPTRSIKVNVGGATYYWPLFGPVA